MANELLPLTGEVLSRSRRPGFQLWILAAVVGLGVGFLVVSFRISIVYLEVVFYGATGDQLARKLTELPALHRLFAPIVGGALVTLLLRAGVSAGWGPTPKPFALSDVVAARRLRTSINASTLALRDAFMSLLATIISLGSGASAGREEPAAHAGASIGMLPGRLLGLDLPTRRLLVTMAVAAALSAVLHAPLAALILTRELMMPRQRLALMGPIALASAGGWLTSRAILGDNPVIDIPAAGVIPPEFHVIALILTPLFAFTAWAALSFWRWSEDRVLEAAESYSAPVWMLPFAGGMLLGLICLVFPHVMGIGYGQVTTALGGAYAIELTAILVLAKIAASAVTFAFRFGGGQLAPLFFIGAMLGATLGTPIGLPLGDAAGAQVYFGLIGASVMIAVYLRSPLFAALLALELTGDVAAAAGALACAYLGLTLIRRFTPGLYEQRPASQPLHAAPADGPVR